MKLPARKSALNTGASARTSCSVVRKCFAKEQESLDALADVGGNCGRTVVAGSIPDGATITVAFENGALTIRRENPQSKS
jgi:hypothetical protein